MRKIGESWTGNKDFSLESVAYMNINKRGGLSQAKDRDEVTVTLIATGIRECEKKIVEPDFVSIEKNRYKSPIEEMSIKVPAFLQKKIKNNL